MQQYALRRNQASVFLPTTVDINHYNTLKNQHTEEIVIGWIGSHSTIPYLKLIEPVLQQLEQKYSFRFVVIADQKPELKLRSLEYIPWKKETEIDSLLQLNIGVMPLPDTEWARGKCAFKALQYMALGIPAVVSAVGANTEAVPNKVVGYTCNTQKGWYERLEQLIQDESLRERLGAEGRNWVQAHYSVDAHASAFLNLFT
nr:glycosyltransferase family 4 protein [Pontibacter harenae]